MFRFDPISGKPIDGGLIRLQYRIKQMGLLPDFGNDYVSGLLLLDDSNNVYVYPPESAKKVNEIYIYISEIFIVFVYLFRAIRCICTQWTKSGLLLMGIIYSTKIM